MEIDSTKVYLKVREIRQDKPSERACVFHQLHWGQVSSCISACFWKRVLLRRRWTFNNKKTEARSTRNQTVSNVRKPRSREDFEKFLSSLKADGQFTKAAYDVKTYNCIHFALLLLTFFGVDTSAHADLLKYPQNAINSYVRNAVILIASCGFPPAVIMLETGALLNAAGVAAATSVIAGQAVARKLDYKSWNSTSKN
ncbi:Oidioi.mRNA.OKI2018_I69.XSR.g13476.t1.cds [Oikopleura dioica]|uniref:Oidioi.mRNA.OKI2018_I69.XSR.g13476.t1.cds n=1 Tax=Oikopleura dioica TaxID=34765 RepID=A0ABN7SAV2_OIKDI|nr:Oidioi.mRNA.OKI2018_I69.XSR.g13476.t1.cds [Oikopleura dioica]